MSKEKVEEKAVQPLNRDIQILIGEKISTQLQGNYLDENFFKLLECTPIIRASSLKVLSKLSIFTLNHYSHVQFSSPDKKYSLRIDLTKLQGYLYLRRLVEELSEFIKEVYLLSIEDIDVPELIKTLEKIKGIKVLSLPYDFDNCRTTKKFERLIQNNSASLVALKHLVLPMSVPNKMRERLIAINSSTLRNCSSSTEKERDFYAFYTKEAKYPDCLDPLPEQGIVMRISVHRYNELFRAAKRAFTGEMLNKISVLKMVAVSNCETKSAKQMLEQMAGATKYFNKLERVQFEMRMLDSWPNHWEFPPDDDDFPHVSQMVIDAQLVYNFALAWLTDPEKPRDAFPFKLEAKVCLLVDYLVGQNEQAEDVLEKAMKQTEEILGQRFDKKMQWTITSGRIIGSLLQQVSENVSLEFILDYRSMRYCKEGEFKEDRRFHIGHTL